MLEVDPIYVRTSERKDWMRCPQKWWWAYVDRLKPNTSQPALQFGDLVHRALAVYYPPGKKRGPHPANTFETLWEENIEQIYGVYDDEGTFLDARKLGHEMLVNYVKEYAKSDSWLEIIAPEQKFQIDLYDSETGDYLCTYVGTVDALCRDLRNGRIGFVEHKTTAGLPPRQWLPMDEQAGSYWALTPPWLREQGILKPGEDIDFILYNFLKKKGPDTRDQNELGQYLNQNGSVSKRQPGPLFYRELVYRNPDTRAALLERVEWQVTEMRWMREGKLPVLKNTSDDCKFCQFKDMCELHENNAEWEEYRDAMFNVWKPYEDHEIPTEVTR